MTKDRETPLNEAAKPNKTKLALIDLDYLFYISALTTKDVLTP